MARTIVASIRTTTARPTPIPSWTRARRRLRSSCPVEGLADTAEDEHVVVHREAEQDDEQEQRDPRGDAAGRGEPEDVLAIGFHLRRSYFNTCW
jgi:hypothetical protein